MIRIPSSFDFVSCAISIIVFGLMLLRPRIFRPKSKNASNDIQAHFLVALTIYVIMVVPAAASVAAGTKRLASATFPTPEPTPEPTTSPTLEPTSMPTVSPLPTMEPTASPLPMPEPTRTPVPTLEPTVSPLPTLEPTVSPLPTMYATFDTPFGAQFFKGKCLLNLKTTNDGHTNALSIVDEYLGRWVTALSISSVLVSGLQLLVFFMVLQTGGVPNPRSKNGTRVSRPGLTLYLLWMALLLGGIGSTFSSLLSTVLSYGSLVRQYSDCLVLMRSGDAFLHLTLPPLLVLHPLVVTKAGMLSANLFVLQQGAGVGLSLSSNAVKRMFYVTMLVLWGLPVVMFVVWFFVTLCFFWSSIIMFPIALVQLLELGCVWRCVAELKRRLERRSAVRQKAQQSEESLRQRMWVGILDLLGSPFASGGVLASSLWWVEAEWQQPAEETRGCRSSAGSWRKRPT